MPPRSQQAPSDRTWNLSPNAQLHIRLSCVFREARKQEYPHIFLAQFQSFVKKTGCSCTTHFPPHGNKQAMNLLTKV